jgi:hypothetical protein
MAQDDRLDALLRAPPEHQNTVSKALRAQVLVALRELLGGFERANRIAGGTLLPGDGTVYPALVSVILRMVFVLFAEEKGLLPMESETYAASYSLSRLHAQLREDLDRRGQSIEDRHGAWARVVALFRLLHTGIHTADGLVLPARHGRLFDPEAYPFLDGRAAARELPEVPDGAVLRVLDRLLVLDGERLQYRGLDVEHIGSVYEGLMGFEVQTAKGVCLTLQPDDIVVDLESLATLPAAERLRFLADEARLNLKGKLATAVKSAQGAAEILAALGSRASPRCPHPIAPGSLFLQPGEERRRFGAHYTSRALTRVVVERTLAPLLHDGMSPEDVLALEICDPAMGSGAFLVEACRQLADQLVHAWERTSRAPSSPPDEDLRLHARRLIAQRCLYGVDKNPLAVELARMSLWLETFARQHPFTFVDHALRRGDSLLGLSREQIGAVSLELANADERLSQVRSIGDLLVATVLESGRSPAQAKGAKGRKSKSDKERAMPDLRGAVDRLLAGEQVEAAARRAADVRSRHAPFHWQIELPEVFERRGGFDAILGNPPWVSYAGRAAQPLAEELRTFYLATSAAFAGYRNLQGIFVERAAAMLRPGGRLGLVLPTSMSDLAGYEPSRRAHDVFCICDADLPDFGDAFDDVFQPSMALLSTRRPAPVVIEKAAPWPLERKDLDPVAASLLDRLGALPKLPGPLFGERGLQTVGVDVRRLHELAGPEGRFTTEVREGGDIQPFLRRAPRLYCDPSELQGHFRAAEDWRAVKLLIRQTARIPIVAPSDGAAFRNSLLAGFEDEAHSASFLLAYLNSTPIRWFHYFRHRDARQGMPQMKIGHLRAFPDLPPGAPGREKIERLGAELGARNSGITPEEQAHLDALVAEALGLDDAARERLAAWAASLDG